VHIEHGKAGDTVGAVRRVRMADTQIRQRLLAHCDRDRFYTYEACEPYRFPVRDFVATIRVMQVTEGNRASVEWWATLCARRAEPVDATFRSFVRSLA
jgi:hypothetical protein